ncbi:hypothetical protein CFC21_014357 [Triticum aestivum]|uniref:Cytochrome P450 n=2 Tax=Triticum aestivum TaxID=4565 RepID=A0A9R1DU15_WHEAT|nr:dolabradiene monooxygenase-like [Triticum dicoccoides]XP_044454462.1 dolabradiene monooxygenase-like [Triticum aestivum]KAF6998219.1 hypothetical protein CFC21_014357 [Triticum aestivum]
MEEYSYLYLGLALVSLLVVVLAGRRRTAKHGVQGLRPPPSPWALPVIGHLHHLVGALPHHAMRGLSRRHGSVMLLRLGEVPTLVITSREAASEVMKTHDTVFASRRLRPTTSVLTNGGREIIFAPYGEYWRQLRKIAVTELLTARRIRSFRWIREEEVAATLHDVAEAAVKARPMEMRARLSTLVAETMVRAVMGVRCKDIDVFLTSLERAVELAGGFNLADLWPSSRLACALTSAGKEAKECRDAVFGILDGIIQKHLERTGDGHTEDLLDVLLKIQKEGDLKFPLDMDDIKSFVFGLFAAGSESVFTTLEWVFAELTKNPRVMQRTTAEVRQAFEASGTAVEGRLGELPYMHLVIRETLRLHPAVPLLIPRESREMCQVLGYDVPQGTQVLVNVWAMGRDERYWDAPEEFRPERFECEAARDFKGLDFELLPFGAGRRMCPGMNFGVAVLELALASLLLHFDWEWEEPGLSDPTQLDMTETFGLTARRKANLLLRPVLRVPVPVPVPGMPCPGAELP